jgi:hypothetical protein
VTCEHVDRLGEVLDVGVVDHPRCRHERAEVDAQPQGVEPLGREEGGIVVAEAERRGMEGRGLRDLVEAVHEHGAAEAVDQPAAGRGQRRDGAERLGP